jgi:hypothetical protein
LKGRSLIYFIFSLAAIGGIGFFITFRDLDREEETLNELPEGHVWFKERPAKAEKKSFFSRFRRSEKAQ